MRIQIAAVVTIVFLAACAASPRQRVVSAGEVNTGPNTLTAVRQQLEGQWVLESMRFNTEDGKSAAVDATGRLTMDGFGNLSIEFTMTEAGLKSLADMGINYPNPRMSTSGQAAINPQSREITYVGNRFTTSGGMDAETAARRQNPFALERIRYFSFDEQGILTLLTRYNDGKDAVSSRWKKAS
jgi:hypothetical protein